MIYRAAPITEAKVEVIEARIRAHIGAVRSGGACNGSVCNGGPPPDSKEAPPEAAELLHGRGRLAAIERRVAHLVARRSVICSELSGTPHEEAAPQGAGGAAPLPLAENDDNIDAES